MARKLNILYLEWNSFCNEDMYEVLEEMGNHVIRISFNGVKQRAEEVMEEIAKQQRNQSIDFVFSFNYFPEVSTCCQNLGLKYVSWVYDSPYIHVYSYTVVNKCNYIFLFDHAVYSELKQSGIETVYYLPLGVNEKRMSRLSNTQKRQGSFRADVSFVGSLYSEQKHNLFQRFQKMDPFVRGYLEGLMKAQQYVQGSYFLQDMLTDGVIAEMEKIYPTNPNDTTVLSPRAIYADYVLARHVTANERKEIIEKVGEKYPLVLYTYDKTVNFAGVENRGFVDYYNDMPYVFQNSKINLNITLRSIKTGIPLRAFDIMGSGGFLLSNYQEEMFQYFEPGNDFVYYEDYDDLCEKIAYYLEHDEERIQIAKNGQQKVFANHTLRQRVEIIMETIL